MNGTVDSGDDSMERQLNILVRVVDIGDVAVLLMLRLLLVVEYLVLGVADGEEGGAGACAAGTFYEFLLLRRH